MAALFCRVRCVCAGQSGLVVCHADCGRACPGESADAAQRTGQLVPAALRRARSGARHRDRRDEQEAAPRFRARRAPRGQPCRTWTWPPRSPRCRTRRTRARPGRAGRRGPGRRNRRPPAGPARSDRSGPRAVAAVRAGRPGPVGRAVPGVLPRCARPARGRRRHRRPARLPPGRRRSLGTARPGGAHARLRAPAGLHVLEDVRTCARHQDRRVLAAACAGPAANGPAGYEA
jgi:hypothetical protein